MLDFSEPGGGLFSSDPGDHSSDKSTPQSGEPKNRT